MLLHKPSSPGAPAKVAMQTTLLAFLLASVAALGAPAAPTSTKWVLSHSAITIKEHCCFYCDTATVKGCYDQANHQRRHDLAFVADTEVHERPPAYCVPSISCTLMGSPFKSSARTKTTPELYYTIAGKHSADGAPPAPVTYSRTRATISRDSVVTVESGAAVALVRADVAFESTWLDVLGASLRTARSNLHGSFHLVQLSRGLLSITSGVLSASHSKVLVVDGSTLAGDHADISFSLRHGNDPKANPMPFIFSGSTLSLSHSTLSFENHPDVFFDSSTLRMAASTIRAVNSDIRFFDSVLDLRSCEVVLQNSTLWLFNTTLVQDSRVVQVRGKTPVKLGEVLGRQTRSGTPVTGTFSIAS